MANKGLLLHGGILLLAGALALRAWTKEADSNGKNVAAELWTGTPRQIERIEFETKSRKVALEPRDDETGRYYVGTVEKVKPKAEAVSDPHAPPPPPTLADPATEKETIRFVSSAQSETLGQQLASMKANRVLGKIEEARWPEFGFDADHGVLRVTIGGKQHQLSVGGDTPGGGDIYVRDSETNEGYVVNGSITSALNVAESRLIEREFHTFTLDDVERVRIIKGAATREIVKLTEQKGFWADPKSPETKDETASNWMSKIERLKVTSYVEKPSPDVKPEDLVVRVEYLGARDKLLGFLEIVRRPAQGETRPEYYAKSEQSRWYALVLRSAAEQVDQDSSSILAQ
jgi:hypothetical protein